MSDVDDSIEWDFVNVVARWNLYGLPVLLVVVAIAALIRSLSRPGTNDWGDSSRIVRRIGLIHCALAVQALMFLAQELLTMRTMGIPESHIGLAGGLISTVLNPVLAIGLLRRWSLVRRLAIAWYAILSLLAVLVIAWRLYYQVAFDPATWPELAVSRIMPLFLFVVMLLPRIKRVFVKGARMGLLTAEQGNPERASAIAEAPIGWPVVSLPTVLFLIVVCSNVVVDAADWVYRVVLEPESIS
jgi:hypothetical protein